MSSNESLGRARAEAFRAEHELGVSAVKDVFALVHATTGIDVLSLDAGEAEHGLSMRDPATGRSVIAVATTSNPMRQRTSVAHELGHVLAGDIDRPTGDRPGARTPAEIQADTFARHLLLPLAAVRIRVATSNVSRAELSAIVQEFEVSPRVAAIQLKETRYIDAATCGAWAPLSAQVLAAEFGWLSQYRSLVAASQQPRAPQALMARAVAGYYSGVLGLPEVALWYGQDAADLEAELGPPSSGSQIDEDWGRDAPLFPTDRPSP
ncbi:MAG: ImmA/IrrE family metallo-endopeptidase [Actinomycetota bacterium]|nr:MAG: ImmA/IrrE family metallo-endopeptidase [Actinomycetota bacterium]